MYFSALHIEVRECEFLELQFLTEDDSNRRNYIFDLFCYVCGVEREKSQSYLAVVVTKKLEFFSYYIQSYRFILNYQFRMQNSLPPFAPI